MTMFNRSQAWAVALLAVTFVAGAGAGWAIQAVADDRGREVRRRGPDAMVEYLGHELNLSPAQRDSVRAVFARHKPAMDALWQEVHPRMDGLRQAMRAEIAQQLDEQQRERYREMIAEIDARHRHNDSTTKKAN